MMVSGAAVPVVAQRCVIRVCRRPSEEARAAPLPGGLALAQTAVQHVRPIGHVGDQTGRALHQPRELLHRPHRTVSGRRLLSSALAVCTPLMLSSRARALKRPRWSIPSRTLSPWQSTQRRNRPRPGNATSPAVTIVSPAARVLVPSGTTIPDSSSTRQAIPRTVSRTRAPSSGHLRDSSFTDSMPRTARPSSLRISK
ncbi:hypothetical protein PUN28_012959 [Cardiocondyla obscurior]|uniref:Uncharacterized protein n=1 Tax=Cardiocondyla obscurior TaxID=286306 RepID=A0AAW2F9H6_9HYME